MKSLKALFVALTLLATGYEAFAGDDNSSAQHWYQVVVTFGSSEPVFTFVGTSALNETDFAGALSREESFIKLDNLLYRYNNGRYEDWHRWDRNAESRIYIHARDVISFQPLVGDPSKDAVIMGN
ncbi:MAG: hypothetical protein ABSE48_13600 [Verrucomicrobiota bacterium]